uniref:Uncharacterized protein n=1 Tax=Salix viminalis TaxID=40686 RepID=A0A6N2KKE0_SALVM
MDANASLDLTKVSPGLPDHVFLKFHMWKRQFGVSSEVAMRAQLCSPVLRKLVQSRLYRGKLLPSLCINVPGPIRLTVSLDCSGSKDEKSSSSSQSTTIVNPFLATIKNRGGFRKEDARTQLQCSMMVNKIGGVSAASTSYVCVQKETGQAENSFTQKFRFRKSVTQSFFPMLSEKHDHFDRNLKEKSDAYRAIIPSDVNNECVDGSDEGDGLLLLFLMKNTVRLLCKYSEANVSISVGDDIGMNLLASVAAGRCLNQSFSPGEDLPKNRGQSVDVVNDEHEKRAIVLRTSECPESNLKSEKEDNGVGRLNADGVSAAKEKLHTISQQKIRSILLEWKLGLKLYKRSYQYRSIELNGNHLTQFYRVGKRSDGKCSSLMTQQDTVAENMDEVKLKELVKTTEKEILNMKVIQLSLLPITKNKKPEIKGIQVDCTEGDETEESSVSNGLLLQLLSLSAAKGPFVPPEEIYIKNRGGLGWKDQQPQVHFGQLNLEKLWRFFISTAGIFLTDATTSKPSRLLLDIDLNVADERILEDLASSNSQDSPLASASVRSFGGLDLDLNRVDEPNDMGLLPAIPSQVLAPTTAIPSHYPRPSFVVNFPDGNSNGGVESSRKWGRQGLDLNAGPLGPDAEGRDETSSLVSRQLSVASSQALAEEQTRMYQLATGSLLKRKEPEGGWDGYK